MESLWSHMHGRYPTHDWMKDRKQFFMMFFGKLLAFLSFINNNLRHLIKTSDGFSVGNNAKHQHKDRILDDFFSRKSLAVLHLHFMPQHQRDVKCKQAIVTSRGRDKAQIYPAWSLCILANYTWNLLSASAYLFNSCNYLNAVSGFQKPQLSCL